jgi:hypothetical protein
VTRDNNDNNNNNNNNNVITCSACERPPFYAREEQIELCTDDVGLECWIYLLKKFQPEVFEMEHFAD